MRTNAEVKPTITYSSTFQIGLLISSTELKKNLLKDLVFLENTIVDFLKLSIFCGTDYQMK